MHELTINIAAAQPDVSMSLTTSSDNMTISLGLSRITALLPAITTSPQPFRAIHVAGTNGKGTICAYLCALLSHSSSSPGHPLVDTPLSPHRSPSAPYVVGRFTSPHLLTPRDSITLYQSWSGAPPPPPPPPPPSTQAPSPQPGAPLTVPLPLYTTARQLVASRNVSLSLRATPFELLTATAFTCFALASVRVAVVEVGVGGTLDATNALADKDVAVLGRIGLDHQRLLGGARDEAEIAAHKAGIVGRGVGVVLDGANDEAVVKVLEREATQRGASSVLDTVKAGVLAELVQAQDAAVVHESRSAATAPPPLERHQLENAACALAAYRLFIAGEDAAIRPGRTQRQASDHAANLGGLPTINTAKHPLADASAALAVMRAVRWPGRLQWVDLSGLPACESSLTSGGGDATAPPRRTAPALLDGAHNPQSAAVLASYVDRRLRGVGADGEGQQVEGPQPRPVTWLLAASHDKDLAEMARSLRIRSGDRVVAAQFGPVEDMPWVRPADAGEVLRHATEAAEAFAFEHGEEGRGAGNGDVLGKEELYYNAGDDVPGALVRAVQMAGSDGPLVVAGSLYLVSHVLRYLKDVGLYADGEE